MRDRLTLLLIIAMSFFLMADMFITPAIIPELAAEYGVSTDTLGWAGSAFMLLGSVVGLWFGYLNDRVSRKRLLIATVVIGELACLLTGIAWITADFKSFLLMRMLTGVGVGGIFPITFSLLSDYVSERHRAKASAVVDIAWGLGMMSGPLMATWAVTTDYGWRMAFVLAALPAFPLVLLYALIAREPERGAAELSLQALHDSGGHYQARMELKDYRLILANRSNLLLFLQGIPGSLPWGLLPFWIITFFREERGFDSGDATLLWEVFGIATVVGGLLWAAVGDALFRKRASYVAILCSVVILLGMVPEFLLLNLQLDSVSAYFSLAVAGGLLISVASSNVRALLMNVNLPEHRGSVFALYNFADNIGKGLGPAIGGIILAATSDYQFMVNLAVSSWLVCAVIFSTIIFTVDRDRQTATRILAERGRVKQSPDGVPGRHPTAACPDRQGV